MNRQKAIPQGYMTVGEMAKKMGTTVRTLQYYDKEKILCPSAESEGGRRLYTDKDLVKLHQIMSLKSIGFSLDDIRKNMTSFNTPDDVAKALSQQTEDIKRKIEALSNSLDDIERLREEVLQMQSVDFKKYADIIVNLQMKNNFYSLIKRFDEKTLDHIRSRFDKESAAAFMESFTRLGDEIVQLKADQVPPDSEEGQKLAEKFWNLIMEFADGDMSILPKLMEIGQDMDNEGKPRQDIINSYIEPALASYFAKMGVNPLPENDFAP